jgi:hypothetical protein
MKTGDLVRVIGPPGAVTGEVMDVRPREALVDVLNIDTSLVKEILAQADITKIAMISYAYGDQEVCFVAFQDSRGKWSDLQGQQLSIQVEVQRKV